MNIEIINSLNKKYRYIFLIQNLSYWNSYKYDYNIQTDLILTFDFGLKEKILSLGGTCEYIDHIVGNNIMQHYNFETYNFFSKWHQSINGDNMLSYRGLSFEKSLRIELWNELTYYPRLLINFLALKTINYNKIFVTLNNNTVFDVLNLTNISYETINITKPIDSTTEFNFPIFRWMNEQVYRVNNNLKSKIKNTFYLLIDKTNQLIDLFYTLNKAKNYLFIQRYHPTASVMDILVSKNKTSVVSTDYYHKINLLKQRKLSIKKISKKHKSLAINILNIFENTQTQQWIINNINIGDFLKRIFINKIKKTIPYHFAVVDSIFKYFKYKNLLGMVTISNLGIINCLVLEYCKHNKLPVFLVINGLLATEFDVESKDATYINAYGESIKNNYFKNFNNIVCLGDPRMDTYANSKAKIINTINPVITIGTAGFNLCDLNAYIAYEFDFIFDILSSINKLILNGVKANVILKIRANGYLHHYEEFIAKYFPNITIEMHQTTPIKDLLLKTDLYISTYSQTLFEASALGIPVIYYKKDNEIIYPPFDGKSEIITATSTDELNNIFTEFLSNNLAIFDNFRSYSVMEKFVGKLDGKSTQRNLNFIYSHLIENTNNRGVQ